MHRPVTSTLHVHRVAPGAARAAVTRLARPVVAALGTLAVGMALAACSTQSPTQTNVPYLQSDGVPANVGVIQARNLLLVAQSTGSTGVLSGSVINSSSSPASVTFLTVADSQGSSTNGTTIQLAAHQQQVITGVQFPNLQASPGSLTGIVLKTTAGLLNVQVPVLLPTGVYSTITATAVPSTATSASSTPTSAATTGGATDAPTPATATATDPGTSPATPTSPTSPTSPTG